MPLNKALLSEEIKQALDDESDKDVNPAEARNRLANKIADAIDKYIKAGDVNSIVSGASATGKMT